MNLKTSYINFLKQKHNSEYYLWNTYPVRFLKSETNFGEIFIVFLHDSIVLLLLTYQIKLFYNIDLYFFFVPFLKIELTMIMISIVFTVLKIKD